MAINFTKNIEQYTTTTRSTRVKHFMEFASKKQLESAGVLESAKLEFVKGIKNTFTFALHNDKRYMAITLYKASAENKYSFLILDLQEQAIAEVGSIKEAKAEILELVAQDAEKTEEVVAEEQVVKTRKRKNNKAEATESDMEETR